MEAEAYFLFHPPNPLKPRFVLLDETTHTFHDTDLQTLPGNPASLQQQACISPSIPGNSSGMVFHDHIDEIWRSELQTQGFDPSFQTGQLVSIDRREGERVNGEIIVKVNVKPLPQ